MALADNPDAWDVTPPPSDDEGEDSRARSSAVACLPREILQDSRPGDGLASFLREIGCAAHNAVVRCVSRYLRQTRLPGQRSKAAGRRSNTIPAPGSLQFRTLSPCHNLV